MKCYNAESIQEYLDFEISSLQDSLNSRKTALIGFMQRNFFWKNNPTFREMEKAIFDCETKLNVLIEVRRKINTFVYYEFESTIEVKEKE